MRVTDGIQMEMTRRNILYSYLGIHKPPSKKNPISLITRNSTSDEYTANFKERLYDYLIMNKIPNAINMSIADIMKMTTYEFICMRASITRLGKQRNSVIDNVTNNLDLD
jgi:hypothetical protein